MGKITLPLIEGFISISSKGFILHLEAEEEPFGSIFAISLDSDSIAQIKKDLFDNADKTAQVIKDAVNGNHPQLIIIIAS